jgi:hypothetical protein
MTESWPVKKLETRSMSGKNRTLERWFGLWCFMSLSTQYFSYVVVINFIGGGNRRKPEQDSNSQR